MDGSELEQRDEVADGIYDRAKQLYIYIYILYGLNRGRWIEECNRC